MKTLNRKKAGVLSGITILFIAVAAGFSFGYVYNELIIPGSPEKTAALLSEHMGLFYAGIAGWGTILVGDVLLSWSLYSFFRETDAGLAKSMGMLRLVYSVVLLWAVIELVLAGTSAPEVSMRHIDNFNSIWSAGLVIFGLHLFLLGILAFKDNAVHKIWNFLLLFAGVSYSMVHVLKLTGRLTEVVDLLEKVLSAPMAIAEIGFGIWLLVYGLRKTHKV